MTATKKTSARTSTRTSHRTRVRRHWEPVLAILAAVILFTIAWPTFGATHSAPPIIWPLISALATLPLVVAPYRPIWSWGLIALACALAAPLEAAAGYELAWPVTSHLALTLAIIWAMARCQLPQIPWVIALSVALMMLNPGLDSRVGWSVGVLLLTAFILLIRWLWTSRRQLASSTVLLAKESARSAEEADLRILAEERNRLARDLHDVVAHQMSMVVVQAQSAPYRLQNVTPAIHSEFDTIADTARSALDEVRSLLGVLRTDAESSMTTPVGANQILPTLNNARRSGVDITWTIQGELGTIDEKAGVVAHRILQESLSNAMRHAPGSTVLVNLVVEQSQVSLEVNNSPAVDGVLPTPDTVGGTGIQGMAARVRAVGGTFTAAPAADGGFTVQAEVPLRQRG